jgi:signal transduction histidine kinase
VAVLIGAGFGSYWLARRTLKPIAAANEQQKQFVADASHELRTPVTALKMGTEVALMDTTVGKEALRDALQSNLEEADKLERLLNSLLRLSKLDSDVAAATLATIDLKDVIAHAVEQTKRQSTAKHIAVDNTIDTSMTLTGDKDSLEQLFIILLDNAVKYSPAQSTITILGTMHDHTVTVTVADQGIGIESEALGHVFDRFYRADKARTSNNGFGLGLAIAKHIADLHQGSITLKSAAGRGTKAIVNLPLEPTDQAA